jgi:small subunit ribosomal protein S4
MARYTGPKVKKARALGEAIFGYNKYFESKKYPPGQHGAAKRRKQRSDYAIQLTEKQKAKYTYGVLERQFRRMYEMAARKSGVTGEILLQLLEARLDNVVFRLGIAKSRDAARQMVGHKHIVVNGVVTNIPSYILKAGDVVAVRGKSLNHPAIEASIADNAKDAGKYSWLAWNNDKKQGIYLNNPTRDLIPEKINEQLIIELYNR